MRFAFPTVLIAAVLMGLAALVMHRPDQRAVPAPPSAAAQASGPAVMTVPAAQAPAPPQASAARPAALPAAATKTALASADRGDANNQVGMSGGDRVPAINLGHDQMAAAPSPSAAQPPRPQPPAAKTVAAGDIEEGHKVFRKCQACHSLQAGKELVGPSLAGIIGRKSGAEPGFSYSPAMKEANIIWDAQTLAAYLTDPQKAVPGIACLFPASNPITTVPT